MESPNEIISRRRLAAFAECFGATDLEDGPFLEEAPAFALRLKGLRQKVLDLGGGESTVIESSVESSLPSPNPSSIMESSDSHEVSARSGSSSSDPGGK